MATGGNGSAAPVAEKESEGDPEPQQGPLRVLVILGHPRQASLCGAIADTYVEAASGAGARVEVVRVGALDFDPDVRTEHIREQALEPDVSRAQRLIREADHLAFVFPTWWGVMPARLKGFLDRVLTPGFAFREVTGGIGYEGLLKGRTADLLITMDTPSLAHRLAYGAPSVNAMRRAILGFCGIETVRTRIFDRVKERGDVEREGWLREAAALGARLGRGPRGPVARALRAASPWFKIARLQFYPMTWLAYLLGALLAGPSGLAPVPFAFGLVFLIALEFATVLINEQVDLESDRLNRHWGPFTGGSRVLVDGTLTRAGARRATVIASTVAAGAALMAIAASPAPGASAVLALLMAGLAVGYTLPPLMLSWRTLGEATVAVTHGLLAVLTGLALQGGPLAPGAPWLVGALLSLAVLPSITLAGVPDRDADGAVGKRTIAVRLGVRHAVMIAGGAAALAAMLPVALAGMAGGLLGGLAWLAVPHGGLLVWRLWRIAPWPDEARRIDGTLVLALTFMLWFALLPLVNLALA